jgi:hypothetical protein
VGYTLHGVIGDAGVLAGLRHPSMHAMVPLRLGMGLCPVRSDVVVDEPLADVPGELRHLTTSVLDYLQEISKRAPVVYVTADFSGGSGTQAACGWSQGRRELGPLHSRHEHRPRPARGLVRTPHSDTGAIDSALRWLGVARPRRADRFEALGLAERRDWEP